MPQEWSVHELGGAALGEEMSEHAKIWVEYSQEAAEFDRALLRSWNRTIDTMLVIAALFSAVVTTFLIQTYGDLVAQNPQDLTNALLLQISDNLRGAETVAAPPVADAYAPPSASVWMNALWFTSLTCSLGAGSIAMLAKQWLNAYTLGLSASHRLRAQTRQRRFDALVAWRTPEIIGALPLALSVSLLMFLAGLSVLLFTLNAPIAITCTAIIAVTALFHLCNLVLPALCNCPWKTAISPVMYRVLFPVRRSSKFVSRLCIRIYDYRPSRSRLSSVLTIAAVCLFFAVPLTFWCLAIIGSFTVLPLWKFLKRRMDIDGLVARLKRSTRFIHRYRLVRPRYLDRPFSFGVSFFSTLSNILTVPAVGLKDWWKSSSEASDEITAIDYEPTVLQARAISWLIRKSPHPSITEHSMQAIAGLPFTPAAAELVSRYLPLIRQRLMLYLEGKRTFDPTATELYARALWRVQSVLSIINKGRGREWRANVPIARRVSFLTPSEEEIAAAVSCMCACSMLNEIVHIMEAHCEGQQVLSSFHLRMIVETLGQEVAWRKRADISSWTASGLGGLDAVVIPLLVHLLEVPSSSDPPRPLDTSVSLALAIFTQAIPAPGVLDLRQYADEAARVYDFNYLVCASLSTILRFPSHFGCADFDVSDIARAKYQLAAQAIVHEKGRENPHYHTVIGQVFKHVFAPDISVSGIFTEEMLRGLAEMDRRAYLSLDAGRFKGFGLYWEQTLQMSSEARLNFLQCYGRLQAESGHANSQETSSVGFVWIKDIMAMDQWTKMEVFRVMVQQVISAREKPPVILRALQGGFLDLVTVVFDEIGVLQAEDVGNWMTALSILVNSHRTREFIASHQRALPSFIRWSYQDWRGRSLMFERLETLETLADKAGVSVKWETDTSWFRPTVPTKMSLAARGNRLY